MGSETTPRGPARLQRLPSWLAGHAAHRAHRLVTDALAEEGYRRHHYAVLATIDELGTASQSDVGRLLWLDRSNLHAIVNDLETAGLVARERDEHDRRRNLVALTPGGRQTLARLQELVERAQEALLAPLGERDRAELVRLLTELADAHPADG